MLLNNNGKKKPRAWLYEETPSRQTIANQTTKPNTLPLELTS